MYKFNDFYMKARVIVILVLVMIMAGCGSTFFTSKDEDKIELPTLLGYSVRVMEASQGMYDTILNSSADLYRQGVIDDEQVAEIIIIANKYKASHNTAQKAVSSWYNAYVNNEPGIDQASAITEVLNLVSLAPEIINDINEVAGTSFELPETLDIEFLVNLINKREDN